MLEWHALFESLLESTRQIERETREADSPLATLFRTVSKEQEQQLERLLPKLLDGLADIAVIKNELSIVYHDDELLDSYFRAWLRHLKWSDDPFAAKAERLLSVLEGMRSKLEEAAVMLEDRFGYDTIKYVVPSFYMPTLR